MTVPTPSGSRYPARPAESLLRGPFAALFPCVIPDSAPCFDLCSLLGYSQTFAGHGESSLPAAMTIGFLTEHLRERRM